MKIPVFSTTFVVELSVFFEYSQSMIFLPQIKIHYPIVFSVQNRIELV